MDRQVINVFPDYMSTGLWNSEGANIEPDSVGVGRALQLALKYWHEVWEFAITEEDEDERSRMSQRYIDRWNEDGRKLAELMTAESTKYVFVYKE